MKRLKQITRWILGILALSVIILIIASPYKHHSDEFRTVEASIVIDAPVDSVFAYMSNSDYASDWSSYVDHITPLNAEKVDDGEKYSIRRVFISKDEKEARWDEKIVDVVPNKRRALKIYKIKGLAMSAKGLQTEQRYQKLKDGSTRLSLVLYYQEAHRGLWNGFKMHIASFEVHSVFEKNLENIKREIEEKWKN